MTLEQSAQIEYPPVLVEKEIDHLLQDQVGPRGERGMEQYLQRIGKTEEELREQLRPTAEERVRHSLLLSKVAEVENITVDENEVTEEAEKIDLCRGPAGRRVPAHIRERTPAARQFGGPF